APSALLPASAAADRNNTSTGGAVTVDGGSIVENDDVVGSVATELEVSAPGRDVDVAVRLVHSRYPWQRWSWRYSSDVPGIYRKPRRGFGSRRESCLGDNRDGPLDLSSYRQCSAIP